MEGGYGRHGGDWMRGLSLLLGLLLSSGVFVKGETTNTTRLEQVRSFHNTTGEVCVKPLSGPVDPKVALRLMVRSTANSKIYEGGNATVKPELLMANVWSHFTFQHVTENYRHALKVEMDGNPLTFNKQKRMFINSYGFEEVLLLVKGRVMLSDCPPPQEPTTTTYSATYATYSAANSSTSVTYNAANNSTSVTYNAANNSTSVTYNNIYNSTYATYFSTAIETPSEEEVVIGGRSWIWALGGAGGVPLLIVLLVLVILLVVVLVFATCFWHKRRQNMGMSKKYEHTAVEYRHTDDAMEAQDTYNKLFPVPEDSLPANSNMMTFQSSIPSNKQVNTSFPSSFTNQVNTSNSFTNYINNPMCSDQVTTSKSPISYNSNPLYSPPNNGANTTFSSPTDFNSDVTNLAYTYPENQGMPNK